MTGASGRGKQLAAAIGVTVQGPMQSLAGIAPAGTGRCRFRLDRRLFPIRAGTRRRARRGYFRCARRHACPASLRPQPARDRAGRSGPAGTHRRPLRTRPGQPVPCGEPPVARSHSRAAGGRAAGVRRGRPRPARRARGRERSFRWRAVPLPRAAVPRHDGAAGAASVDRRCRPRHGPTGRRRRRRSGARTTTCCERWRTTS